MRKRISILVLAAMPALALAAGGNAGSHGMDDHQMPQGHDTAHDMTRMLKDKHAMVAGKPGDSTKASRTIEVTMGDSMRFSPSNIRVSKGETVRFFLKNQGKILHEMVIGTQDEFDVHASMMRQMPDMSHIESNVISLSSGQSGDLVWQFTQSGTVDFACLQPGHRESGMAGKVTVN
nr:cupredoxin family protein [Sedimenticola hydrogenitrophicus]